MFGVLGTNSVSPYFNTKLMITQTEFTYTCGEDFLLHLQIHF